MEQLRERTLVLCRQRQKILNLRDKLLLQIADELQLPNQLKKANLVLHAVIKDEELEKLLSDLSPSESNGKIYGLIRDCQKLEEALDDLTMLLAKISEELMVSKIRWN